MPRVFPKFILAMDRSNRDYRPRPDEGYSKRPRYEEQNRGTTPRQDFNRYPRPGFHEPSLDEDLQFCKSYESWRSLSSDNSSVDKYRDYVKGWAQWREDEFAKRHWKEDWYLERYDPLLAEEKMKERLTGAQKRAEELDPKKLLSLSRRDHEGQEIVMGPEPYPIIKENSAHIPHVPPNLPRIALEKAVAAEGAVAVLLSEVNKSKKRRDLGRRGTVIFKDAESAKDARAKGTVACSVTRDSDGVYVFAATGKEEERKDMNLKLLEYSVLPNRLLPSESLNPDRESKDTQQALQCAEVLDQGFEISQEVGIKSVLSRRPTHVSELDAIVQYLRYVHLYCYYSGALCRDYGELLHKSAAPFLRPTSASESSTAAKSDAAGGGEDDDEEEHKKPGVASDNQDSKRFYDIVDLANGKFLDTFLGSFEKEKRSVSEIRQEAEKISESCIDRLVADTLMMKGSHAYCKLHDKLFENETFFRKHIINFHSSDVRVAQRSALYNLYVELYRLDEDKPLPRYQRFVDDVLKGNFEEPRQSRGPPQMHQYQDTRRDTYRPNSGRYDNAGRYDEGGDRDRRYSEGRYEGNRYGVAPSPRFNPRSQPPAAGFQRRPDNGYNNGPPSRSYPNSEPPRHHDDQQTWRYRDPDAPHGDGSYQQAPRKLQYRTRVAYDEPR